MNFKLLAMLFIAYCVGAVFPVFYKASIGRVIG